MSKLEEEVEYARIALTNAQSNEPLQLALTVLGYGPERIEQGMALYLQLVELMRATVEARKAKVSATLGFYRAWNAARLIYSRDLEIMRVVLRDQPDQSFYLQLPGKRDPSFAGWYVQAQQLYQGIQVHSELQALLAPAGITPERVADGLQSLAAVSLAHAVQRESEGAAQLLVQRRSEARKQLNNWIALFGISVRKALANTPGQLTMLGLDSTLQWQRRRELALKKQREEKAKQEAEAKAAQEAAQAQANDTATPAQPSEVAQLSAVLTQAQQAVEAARELVAAAGV
ncbi:MAG: hypothetical protein U0175_13190 [Caldilineaceae bacterium]